MTAEKGLAQEQFFHNLAEQHESREFLMVWESAQTSVVVGRGARLAEQVRLDACEADGVPVLRRSSGGGSVVLGRGCLNYTLILNLDLRPHLRDIAESYRGILANIAGASGVPGANQQENDLAIGEFKFGGCAQRRLRRTVLHHGTLLYQFALGAVDRYLLEPSRQPRYRNHRRHTEFLTNAPISVEHFQSRLQALYPEAELVS